MTVKAEQCPKGGRAAPLFSRGKSHLDGVANLRVLYDVFASRSRRNQARAVGRRVRINTWGTHRVSSCRYCRTIVDMMDTQSVPVTSKNVPFAEFFEDE